MSLYEKAQGILDTHVTWQDVEESMQKRFDTTATFGVNKTATNVGDFKGFLSIIALIEPDWIGTDDQKRLPETFIVKICSQLAMISLSKRMKNDVFGEEKVKSLSKMSKEFHNREVEVYRLLEFFKSIPCISVYSVKQFERVDDLKGFLIAEYIPEVKDIGIHDNILTEDLTPVIHGIATFSAHGENLPENEKRFAMGEEYLELLFRQFFNENDMEQKFQLLRKTLEELFPEEVEKLINIYKTYLRIVPNYSSLSKNLGIKKVLNHGDLGQANLLFTDSEKKRGKLDLKAIIDWQICANMSPGLDTSRLLVACLSTEDRRKHGNELLRIYHETFTHTLGKELFTFDELLDAYNLYFPPMVMVVQTRLLPILNTRRIPEPEKSKLFENVMKKVVGLMEDVFEIHDRNLTRFPDLFFDCEC